MDYDYGYGTLGNQLIRLFRSGAPDFEAAEELIRQGVDVNAAGKDDDENILSEILERYDWTAHGNRESDACKNCTDRLCNNCEDSPNPKPGPAMCAIIRFFLDHGFDVTRFDGCYGAQCLWALTLSTYDRYMIDATKLLLDAGAKNRSISIRFPDSDSDPWGFIATEGSYQGTCCHNYDTANIYEAVYQIYQAVEDGKPYSGIDSYETAVRKKIQKVLAEKKDDQPVFFSLDLPEFKKDNCFTGNLYFVYEGGVLVSTPYAEFWTDTILPDTDLADVSEYFPGIVGSTVKNFFFDYRIVVKNRTNYGQPLTTIEMDSGHKVRFSINFGEVKEEERAAYFEIFTTEFF